jgi:phytoene dehydrogenase-like protein
MRDVATPLTFQRYTGNWQGSFEGWMITPASMNLQIKKTLPGLENFYMAGQWVQPGGGLPSGVMTGSWVTQMMCEKDGKKFEVSLPSTPTKREPEKVAFVAR